MRAAAAASAGAASAGGHGDRDTVIGLTEEQLRVGEKHGSPLPIDEDELSAAFDFFDVGGTGKITAAGLKQRLGAFYKNLPAKEIKLLLGDGVFTKESLRRLLSSNELGSCDPVKEAFKVYDPSGTGFVDNDTLRSIFESIGYGEISDEDLGVLIETTDVDRDGRISLDDFRHMLRFHQGPLPDAEQKGERRGAR